MTVNNWPVTLFTVPRPTNYVTFTVHVRPDIAQKFQRMFPRYGEHSKVLRLLIQMTTEGRIKLVSKKSFPATA